MASKTWGLDIGSTGLKAVEITRSFQGYRVTNYGFFPFSRREKGEARGEKIRHLREVRSKMEASGENLILPLASHRTMVHRISFPFRDRKKNQQIVKFEIEPLLPLPVDRVIVDYYPAEKEDQGLVFAVSKKDLADEISLLKDAGLDPESVVPEGQALFWLVQSFGKTLGETGALLDLGHGKTTLIIWKGGRLVLVRSIPHAGGALPPTREGASPGAGEEPDQTRLGRLADEVRRTLLSFEYEAEDRAIQNIYLTGGLAMETGVEIALSQMLQKRVTLLDLGKSHFPDLPQELHPVLAVALGAALGGKASDRVNFRKEEFVSSQKSQKARSRYRILTAYAVILAVLACSGFIVDLSLKEKKYRSLKAEIRKEFTQALPEVKKVVNESQQMKARVLEEKAKVESLRGSSGAGAPLEILRELSLMVDPAWKMRVTELVIDPETLEVNGEANTFDAVNQLKARLDRSPLYREVQLKTARASSLENVVEFKFQMKRRT